MTAALLLVTLLVVWPAYTYGRRRGYARHACVTIVAHYDRPPTRAVPVTCRGCNTSIDCEVSVTTKVGRDGRVVVEPHIDLADYHAHRLIHEGAK